MKKSWPIYCITSMVALMFMYMPIIFANPTNGYLTYQNPAANSAPSTFSTISYVFSLLFTFAVVVGLAYFTSKFLSQRWSSTVQSKNMIVRDMVSLGANKSLYLVEIGNKALLLGVTDHNITHLQDYADEAFINKLRVKDSNLEDQANPAFRNVFQQQIDALQRLAGRNLESREDR
jgi:flagellar protein FliO/FliZ